MVIGEETISKQIIKPSSPTPDRFRARRISFLDQIAPPIYLPIVFFYKNHESKLNHHAEVSQSLKQSLSQILTVFYPLAGKHQENSFIDCDDSGVEFVEARVHARLAQFTEDPKTEELKQLIPVDSSAHTENTLVLVKLSFLDCGGISVGVCWSHKIGDYASFVTFMKAWAATCRGETQFSQPSFDLALYFPPRASAPIYYSEEKEKIITKRLVFDKGTLERVRKQAACGEVKNPTRVEALTASIWRIFIEATKAKRGQEKTSFAALQAINLRPRTIPPIPDHTFGNCYIGKFAFVSNSSISDLVSNMRAAIKSVDDDYIKNVVNDDEYLRILDEANQSFKKGTTDLCNFSSWWRFPVYDVDFGWGKPDWVCTVAQPYKNLVLLMSTPSGDGIEAWINMPEDFGEIFETNYNELLIT